MTPLREQPAEWRMSFSSLPSRRKALACARGVRAKQAMRQADEVSGKVRTEVGDDRFQQRRHTVRLARRLVLLPAPAYLVAPPRPPHVCHRTFVARGSGSRGGGG